MSENNSAKDEKETEINTSLKDTLSAIKTTAEAKNSMLPKFRDEFSINDEDIDIIDPV
ncbi:27446_t:CDS:2, partial [Dentiscutata erythropus]